jgi:hypothetical protein
MELKEILNKIHRTVEAKENQTINRPVMARRVEVSERTYVDYLRGQIKPLAMKALLNLLNELDDDEMVKIIRMWKVK